MVARVSRATYGTECHTEYDEENPRHCERRRRSGDDGPFIGPIFRPIVKKVNCFFCISSSHQCLNPRAFTDRVISSRRMKGSLVLFIRSPSRKKQHSSKPKFCVTKATLEWIPCGTTKITVSDNFLPVLHYYADTFPLQQTFECLVASKRIFRPYVILCKDAEHLCLSSFWTQSFQSSLNSK